MSQVRAGAPLCICLVLLALTAAGAFPARAGQGAGNPPPPGSYTLDHIQRVPQAIVLEGSLLPRLLSSYTRGRITLLGFFYSYCADPNGCPLAWEALEKVREEILARADLHGKVRLVFMSLDPRHDTPSVLEGFARRYDDKATLVPWHFLTTYSRLFLDPLLRAMGEEVSIDREAQAKGQVVLNHLLKVFLIDQDGWVREIYSNLSLDPAMILGDIKTLSIEAKEPETQ